MNERMYFSDKIAWLATAFLFSSIVIFGSYTWGKYILFIGCAIVFLCDAAHGRMKYAYFKGNFQCFMIVLILYTLASSLWAVKPSDCFTKAFTFFQILVCMWVLYNHYIKFNTVGQLLSVVKWSSYAVSIYSIYFYGLNYLRMMMESSSRIGNAYSNINTIGMLAAIGIVLQVDEIARNKKISMAMIFSIPSMIMIITTQSRKAIIILVIGIILVLILENLANRSIARNILIMAGVIIAAYFVLRYCMTLEMFSGINERFGYLIAQFTGKGNAGSSGVLRQKMIELGIEIFKQHPIGGVGIGCPHVVAAERISFDTYLHNNYVEMLAGGGLLGFCAYYISYIYVAVNFVKYRFFKDECLKICVVLLVIFIFRDYAMVSAYSKEMYFYLMMLFVAVEQMKTRAKEFEMDVYPTDKLFKNDGESGQ